MPELTITVRVPWPKQPTLAALERAIFKALMAAGRALLKQASQAIEDKLLAEGGGARQRRRRRYLITPFGELRFWRWQTRTEGRYGYPLDRAPGTRTGDPCSPWVRATAARLAQAHPFRQAARPLGMIIGCRVDHRRLWRWAQGSGRRLRGHWEQKRAALFEDRELPQGVAGPLPSCPPRPTGPFIHSRGDPIEVKLRDVVRQRPRVQRYGGLRRRSRLHNRYRYESPISLKRGGEGSREISSQSKNGVMNAWRERTHGDKDNAPRSDVRSGDRSPHRPVASANYP